jgi:predicted enzyme involved in methoxymalonyl-ACP biosynthesis
VLKRGMENFALNTIVNFAKNNGFSSIIGEYIPSQKNKMVKDHYSNLEFVKSGSYFTLKVSTYQNRKNHIKTKN